MTIPTNGSPDTEYANLNGSKIGGGQGRTVYDMPEHPSYVIKISNEDSADQNKIEAEVYNYATKYGLNTILACLAKVHSISESGKYLIMEKLITNTINPGDSCYIMRELTDTKMSNFGKDSTGTIKCLDYGVLKCGKKPTDINSNAVLHAFPTKEYIDSIAGYQDALDEIQKSP